MADPQLLAHLRQALSARPGGLSEFELMQVLHDNPDCPFTRPDMLDNWSLFRAHFWLFHHLYLLALEWRRKGTHLEIVSTRIIWYARSVGDAVSEQGNAVSDHDPMQAYYLDLDNLWNETPESLRETLNDFWRKMLQTGQPGATAEDWEVLDVEQGSSRQEIRRQYRRQCQRHHPDRGGDVTQFQAIQAAYARISGT